MRHEETNRYTEYYEQEGRAGDHQARMRRDVFHSFLAELIDAAIRECSPQSLLDVGCAEGRYIFPAVSLSSVDVGVDMSEAKLKRGVSQAVELGVSQKTLFAAADAHALPFADNSFDLVLCSQVLEHLKRPDVALRELTRVSRSHVIVSVPVWSFCSPMGFGSPMRSRDYELKKDGHIQWFTVRKIRWMAANAGLHVCKTSPVCIRYPTPCADFLGLFNALENCFLS